MELSKEERLQKAQKKLTQESKIVKTFTANLKEAIKKRNQALVKEESDAIQVQLDKCRRFRDKILQMPLTQFVDQLEHNLEENKELMDEPIAGDEGADRAAIDRYGKGCLVFKSYLERR